MSNELDDAAAWAESEGGRAQAEAEAANAEADYVGELQELLYKCAKELDYVQCVENCNSGLCATSLGRYLVDESLKLLRVDFYCDTYKQARKRARAADGDSKS